ncbi:hypothetical protein [Sphingosinicella sp. BN140058]|uniref:hypothetical protein n=1 Tax=Sphingosinicella sp. BN140058 TaxID=1892855 RepID=UPI0010127526|nr:hypothetical protein [Sphingosinicella sp. BN140058]QAY80394.1 hypothetical protein ETR14_27525 [Sphingosinicella sp. BN140058]
MSHSALAVRTRAQNPNRFSPTSTKSPPRGKIDGPSREPHMYAPTPEDALARNHLEVRAFANGQIANIYFHHGGEPKWRALLRFHEAARYDPDASFTLGNILGTGIRAARPDRRRLVSRLYSRAVKLGLARLDAEEAASPFPKRETYVRDIVSRALVNDGLLYQYQLKMPDIAYAHYLRASRIFPNAVAFMNLGLMNFWGMIPTANMADVPAFYRAAMEAGRSCFHEKPHCPCIMAHVNAIERIPATELAGKVDELRVRARQGLLGAELPPTSGLHPLTAGAVEELLANALSGLRFEQVTMRVAILASVLATAAAHFTTAANDAYAHLQSVADSIRTSHKRNPLMSDTLRESASRAECMTLFDPAPRERLALTLVAIHTELAAVAEELPRGQGDAFHLHVMKTAFYEADPGWRYGLASTAAGAFISGLSMDGIRIAIPTEIGQASDHAT